MEGYEKFGAPAPPLFVLAVRLSNDICRVRLKITYAKFISDSVYQKLLKSIDL